MTTTSLKRSLNLPLLVFYGLGNILGAGIYALVGKVAGHAGMYAPVSFLLASLLATFTAFSYAELSSRYPTSAGESVYVYEGFGLRQLALLVGLLIALAGVLSSAAIIQSFIAYLQSFVTAPKTLTLVIVILVLAALAIWGIVESVRMAALLTVVEIVGLVLVLWAAGDSLGEIPARAAEFVPSMQAVVWYGILVGGLLAFYAYLGFEDMVNVAEEVQDAERNMPRAIIIVLLVSSTLYILIALVSVLTVAPEQLKASDAPLALVYSAATGKEPRIISLIAMFAVINGALIQMIMSSRILYGLSRREWLPAWLGDVNERTRTPVKATLLVAFGMLSFGLLHSLEVLAEWTSFVILLVFMMVNLALVRLKLRKVEHPAAVRVSIWVPLTGALLSLAFVIFEIVRLVRG